MAVRARFYVGITQKPGQARTTDGWSLASGGTVVTELWAPEQPADGPSSYYIEDNESNVAEIALEGTNGFLFDASGSSLEPAICECTP